MCFILHLPDTFDIKKCQTYFNEVIGQENVSLLKWTHWFILFDMDK